MLIQRIRHVINKLWKQPNISFLPDKTAYSSRFLTSHNCSRLYNFGQLKAASKLTIHSQPAHNCTFKKFSAMPYCFIKYSNVNILRKQLNLMKEIYPSLINNCIMYQVRFKFSYFFTKLVAIEETGFFVLGKLVS